MRRAFGRGSILCLTTLILRTQHKLKGKSRAVNLLGYGKKQRRWSFGWVFHTLISLRTNLPLTKHIRMITTDDGTSSVAPDTNAPPDSHRDTNSQPDSCDTRDGFLQGFVGHTSSSCPTFGGRLVDRSIQWISEKSPPSDSRSSAKIGTIPTDSTYFEHRKDDAQKGRRGYQTSNGQTSLDLDPHLDQSEPLSRSFSSGTLPVSALEQLLKASYDLGRCHERWCPGISRGVDEKEPETKSAISILSSFGDSVGLCAQSYLANVLVSTAMSFCWGRVKGALLI